LGYILLFLAGFLLFLHNIKPHSHNFELFAEQSEDQVEKPIDFIDWLFISIQHDLGEGHLECFSQVEYPDFDVDPQLFPANIFHLHMDKFIVGDELDSDRTLVFPRRDILLTTPCLSTSLVRGPPLG
jgi:hypothetical protein